MSDPSFTPSPWRISKSFIYGTYGVVRDIGQRVEMLTDKRGRERRFKTEAQALAAIAKAVQP